MPSSVARSVVECLPPRYRVTRILSESERGATVEVVDTGLRRESAVVKIHRLADGGTSAEIEGEFRRFCARLAEVRHPHVAVPYTFGTFASRTAETFGYTTRAFVSGVSLSALPLPMEERSVARVAAQLCAGLGAVHARGLAHGDVKAENVIVRRALGGRVDDLSQCVLIDFSYRPDSSAADTLNEVTLQYVAPELLEGRRPDARADLYALGVLLYRLLTGRLPFRGTSLPEIIRSQRAREFPPLAAARPGTALRLRRTVEKLLEPNPENRPESAQAAAMLLEESALGDGRALAVSAGEGGFLAREAEIGACLAGLDLDRPSYGVSSLEVHGPRGCGVTTLLRELQDQLEMRGIAVLTARPRAAAGIPLQAQIRDAVHALARQALANGTSEGPGVPETATDLLDDLLVAARERRVVLFVDDWRLVDVGEASFLERLILQDGALADGASHRSGRCQVVLGDTFGVEGDCGRVDRLVAKRVRLAGLTRDEVARILPAELPLQRLDVARIHAATEGLPGRVHALLRRVAAAAPERVESVLEGALAEQEDHARDDDRVREIRALHAQPEGEPILALAFWGEELPREQWRALLERLGTQGDGVPVERLERGTDVAVRSRHGHLGDHVGRALPAAYRDRLAEAIVAATWDSWRSHEPRELLALLRFVARLGAVPARCHWRVCRALIVLLERGCFADLESVTGALLRGGSAPWWVELFREAARTSSGRAEEPVPAGIDVAIGRPAPFFREWIRARNLTRARYREEALRILRTLRSSSLPHAGIVDLALAEDCAWAAAEAGLVDEVCGLRRQILGRVRRWLPLVRRGRKGAGPPLRIRLRACRKVARYQRVRYRTHLLKRNYRGALAACRRERALNRADGSLLREAACLNNEGAAMIEAGLRAESVPVLERCARLRERLDDERGLVIALNNLAAALSATGKFGRAAAVLNRIRTVAARNGLPRQRNLALLNLAGAYARRGQLQNARSVLRQVCRLSYREGDLGAYARALLLSARTAKERWAPTIAEGFLARLERLMSDHPGVLEEWRPDIVRAELAYRARDWAHLHTLTERLRTRKIAGPALAVYEAKVAIEAGASVSRRPLAVEHECPPEVRLRLILLRRRHKRISSESLRRITRFGRANGTVREVMEWLCAYLGGSGRRVQTSTELGLESLSWFEIREGQDDLQIELRAILADLLRRQGRHAEAWRLIEETLVRFRRLERRLARWPRGLHLLHHLEERVRGSLAGSTPARAMRRHRISAGLCVEAFDVLMENRVAGAGAHERRAETLLRLAGAIAKGGKQEGVVDEALDVALEATGAQRVIVITGSPGAHRVQRVRLAGGRQAGTDAGDISWAVVSQVLATGEASVFGDALGAEELSGHRSIAALRLRSLACVPLRAGGRILGVLYLDHNGIAGLFDRDVLGFVELLAGLLTVTLHVGQLEEEAGMVRRELEETRRHIMRAERNRLVGELAAGLVHDLKNVLAAISGRAQLLRRVNQDLQVAKTLDAIEKASGTGAGLVQRLQECARDHSSQSEEAVDLVAVAQEAVDLLGARLEKCGIAAQVRGAGPAIVWGVPGEYRELFLNLFVNACDAMPDGGTLSVDVDVDQAAEQVAVRVKDTGIGMSPETKARIFEPFFTTKGSKGTGLGLVVVRNVVVRHGGTVSVESEPGQGTTFVIVLPCPGAARPRR